MAVHRYWRIRMTTAAAGAYAFAEIQFRTTAGTSLAFSGGAATAADTFGGQPGANDASKAADGNISTLYSSNSTSQPQWWMYDFGAASGNWRDVVEVAITARNDGNFNQAPIGFVPEFSDDGSTWTLTAPISTSGWTSAGQLRTFAVTPANTPPTATLITTLSATNTASIVVSNFSYNALGAPYVILAAIYNENHGSTAATVSSVTIPGLTWALRKRSNGSATGGLETWWTFGSTTLSSVTLTINFSGTYDDCSIVIIGVTGCVTQSAPFDSNAVLPAAQSAPTGTWTPAFSGISTSSAADLLLFMTGTISGGGTQASGFTRIGSVGNPGGSWTSGCMVDGMTVTALQSGVTFTHGSALTNPFSAATCGEAIFDALAGSLPTGGGGGAAVQARALIMA